MFYFYPDKKEKNLSYDHVFQVIPKPVLLTNENASKTTYFDLLYSNSIWRQSSIPTSILMELLLSGGIRNEWTQISLSFDTSAIRRDMDTRIKYLQWGYRSRESE